MQDNFSAWFNFMERPDFDGQGLHVTPGDEGGATNHGWTEATWVAFAKAHGLDWSYAHFIRMGEKDFEGPSRIEFWNLLRCDEMPSGIDVFWCDFQFGSYHATETIQTYLGAGPTNKVDDLTLEAIDAVFIQNPLELLDGLLKVRLAYYKTLSGYAEFGRGWDRRAAECHKLAAALIDPSGLMSSAGTPASDVKET